MIKWGASSRWSSRPKSRLGSIETTKEDASHFTLVENIVELYLQADIVLIIHC